MAISDWRKREIRLQISKGKESANTYLTKISDTIDGLYDNPKGNLGNKVQKLHTIITCFMASLPGGMNDVYNEARELRGRLVHVNPTAHRSRDYGFGQLSLEVEEETDYMLGETQDGMQLSSRKLTEEESEIYFRGERLTDNKLLLTETDEDEEDATPRIFLPGFEYDGNGNIIEEEK